MSRLSTGVFFCLLVLCVLVVESKRKKIKPEVLCETCQAVVYDAVTNLAKLPKALSLDEQIMNLLDKQCDNLGEYAGKAEIDEKEMNEACTHLMDKSLEAGLEENLNKKSNEETLRKKLCIKKSKKTPICTVLWSKEQLPTNRKSPAERGLAQADAFLAANKEKEGIISLASGLQYKVLEKGNGGVKPTINQEVVCHYRGSLENGDEFDSSYSRGEPSSFPPSGVISAWTEALQMMVKGDIWELYVHPTLGYGERGSPPKIGPNALLIFKIEMLGVKGVDDDATLKAQQNKDATESSESGTEKKEL